MYILNIIFCAISFNARQVLHFYNVSRKIATAASPRKVMLAKIISMPSSKISILHAKFCVIPCNRIWDTTTTWFFLKNGIAAPITELYIPKLHHCNFYWYIFCIYIFEQFHLLNTEIRVSKHFRRKWNYSATYWAIFTKNW